MSTTKQYETTPKPYLPRWPVNRRFLYTLNHQFMTKHQKAIKAELDYVKARLNEDEYRKFITVAVTRSTQFFNNGGTLNWSDFKKGNRLNP